MFTDHGKPVELSQEQQCAAKNIIEADITKNIPLTPDQWEDLKKLMESGGVIVRRSSEGKVTVYR